MKHSIQISVEVEVPDWWIKEITQTRFIFSHLYCGYWLAGVKHDAYLGWLCREHDGASPPCVDDENDDLIDDVIAAWKADLPLPKGWHRLNRDAVLRAYEQGCLRWGLDWFTGPYNDSTGYDVVFQLALLGEHRYD